MPKEVHLGLSPSQVKQEKRPGRYADGNGLYLHVSNSGARWWLWRGTVHGRRRELGMGSARLVSLAEAREKAREWRKIARDGGDPAVERDKAKREALTFEDAARRVWADQIEPHGRNEKYSRQWLADLERYAFPVIGKLPVHTVNQSDVLAVLAKIWTERPSTARRVKQRIKIVFDWARTAGHCDGMNPAIGVESGLPKRKPKVAHFEAIPYADLPDAMKRLESIETVPAMALRFLILTAARSGEVRGALWAEIDGDVWTLSGDRMKAGKPHRVPLPDPALAILDRLRGLDDRLIFPGQKRGVPMHDTTIAGPWKAIGAAGTIHGLRSTFRVWAAERTTFPREIAELCLAHQVGGPVERAYARTDLFDRRRALMDQWSRFCMSAGEAGSVVELRR